MRYGTFKRPDFVRDKNSTKYFEISFYLLDLCLVFFIHLSEECVTNLKLRKFTEMLKC